MLLWTKPQYIESLTDSSLGEKHADPRTLFSESQQMHAHSFPCSQHANARHTPHHSNRSVDIQSRFTRSQSNTGIHNPDNNVDQMMNLNNNPGFDNNVRRRAAKSRDSKSSQKG